MHHKNYYHFSQKPIKQHISSQHVTSATQRQNIFSKILIYTYINILSQLNISEHRLGLKPSLLHTCLFVETSEQSRRKTLSGHVGSTFWSTRCSNPPDDRTTFSFRQILCTYDGFDINTQQDAGADAGGVYLWYNLKP